jgi:hypothetical protein
MHGGERGEEPLWPGRLIELAVATDGDKDGEHLGEEQDRSLQEARGGAEQQLLLVEVT